MLESIQKVRAVSDLNGLKWAVFIQCFYVVNAQYMAIVSVRGMTSSYLTYLQFTPYIYALQVVLDIITSCQCL